MTEATETQGAEEAPQAELRLNDLAAMVQIIDICSKRGAFEGSELELIGQVRGRLAAFLKASSPPQEEAEAEAEAEAEESPAE